MELQYSGTVPDTFVFGASSFKDGSVMTASCPKGKGIAGITWRRALKSGKDDEAWKPSGLQVFCGTE